jgi:cytochrome P450
MVKRQLANGTQRLSYVASLLQTLGGVSDDAAKKVSEEAIKEIQRWLPVGPLGNAYVATKELTYAGFTIPGGSYLIPCVWWLECQSLDSQKGRKPDTISMQRRHTPRNETIGTTPLTTANVIENLTMRSREQLEESAQADQSEPL